MRVSISVALAASAVVVFSQGVQDSPFKLTHQQVPTHYAGSSLRMLQGKGSGAGYTSRIRAAASSAASSAANTVKSASRTAANSVKSASMTAAHSVKVAASKTANAAKGMTGCVKSACSRVSSHLKPAPVYKVTPSMNDRLVRARERRQERLGRK
ncbi:hypothetical protein Ae201684P_016628 [Aphanomyces euteiches]|uniref:RxLR effector protein n=1 Tax=Aphanomyces euteiches TaxID=100861 RepID=A0A6G0WCY5_9STRA|nr:hypothetical protein Ae201684_017068 [Aphanomyces euteiches]KAH9094010.1 hypothetical protein Ae201684P_016628 [Aphanomyces euteiches]